MSTQVILVRHGETLWNRVKRIQGHKDIALSELGVDQAARLAARLARDARHDWTAHAIYSSDLARAQQTARPVASALGLPLALDSALRERAYGSFEGLDVEAIGARYPAQYAHWQSRDPLFTPPGGESQQRFYERSTEALAELAARHVGQRIICVTHGGVLDCIYRFARHLPLGAQREHALLNASINVVEFAPHSARIIAWADTRHLDAPSDDDGFRETAARP